MSCFSRDFMVLFIIARLFLWLVLSTGKHFFLNTFYVSSYWIYFFLFKIKMACLSHPFRYKRIMEIPNIIVICSRSGKKIWHCVRFKFWNWAILELQFNSTYNKHIGYAVRVTKFQNFFVSPPLFLRSFSQTISDNILFNIRFIRKIEVNLSSRY